jgi:hypothetical protein
MTDSERDSIIKQLSWIGRQCAAVICYERFCRKYNVTHPAVSRFVEHYWKIGGLSCESWIEWERGFGSLPIGEEVLVSIPKELHNIFCRLTTDVVEVSSATWYCNNMPGTEAALRVVLEIAEEYELELPDLELIARITNHPNEQLTDDDYDPDYDPEPFHHGFAPTDEERKMLRS